MSVRNKLSVHDCPRDNVLKAMRQMLDFLEANPTIDLPESMGELWVRTLARQNRGELNERDDIVEWLARQVAVLSANGGETFDDGEQFGVSKDFGSGVRLTVFVSVGEVCEKITDVRTVTRTEQISESTWHMPDSLLNLGFSLNQEKLREREREVSRFMRGAA